MAIGLVCDKLLWAAEFQATPLVLVLMQLNHVSHPYSGGTTGENLQAHNMSQCELF